MARFGNGRIENRSSKELWVVADGVAHVLAPMRRSVGDVDADGARARDGTPINDHRSWWKVNDLGTMTISDDKGHLVMNGTWFTTTRVEDTEFGKLKYDDTHGWGEPIS